MALYVALARSEADLREATSVTFGLDKANCVPRRSACSTKRNACIIFRCFFDGSTIKQNKRLTGSAPTIWEEFRDKYEVLKNVCSMLAIKTPR